MKASSYLLLALTALPAVFVPCAGAAVTGSTLSANASPERLGTVSFAVSCQPASQAAFNRGVALLHDFWYSEAEDQFQQIVKADPGCSMAYWGEAMSSFHQIWARPDDEVMAKSRALLQQAQSPAAKTERERAYIMAAADFFKPDKEEFQARIEAYSNAMGKLYQSYPGDVDAGAFYALSELAAEAPDDTSLGQEHKAMAVLTPLFAKSPDNPGVVHYIIHACDNPAMAGEGLTAADRYGTIASSGAHAFHMPGHIYARLGMWPQDIASNLGSVGASEQAEARHEGGMMDEPHAYDFLLYAYLQSGQDAKAKGVLEQTAPLLTHIAAMPEAGSHHFGMVPYYLTKYAAFYALEMRDWQSASLLEPAAGSPPEVAPLAYWGRLIADGHLHQAAKAREDLAKYDALVAEVRKGKHAYMVDSTGARIDRDEMLGWVAYAEEKPDQALEHMRAAAALQDKVGQGEVDIPAREMLADMLLDLHQPQQALAEYEVALKLSPNRFNGLYHAGLAAEAAGDKAKAAAYYAALLQSTDGGMQSSRPEFAHVKSFTSSTQLAAR